MIGFLSSVIARAVAPWIAGAMGVGIGWLLIGPNSPWIFAFAAIPVIVTYYVVWPRLP